ncbi:MAG: redoxin family protein [Arenicella sp.]|nr:redoxin family protein [Arenicella sp.]
MTNFLIISNIVLWLCVIGLLFVVFALVRQVGVLYERIAPAGALMIQQALSVGDDAPELVVTDHNGLIDISIGAVSNDGKSQLVFFVAPDCPICKTLLPAFKSASLAESNWLDFVLASDGNASEMTEFIKRQQLQKFPFVNSQKLGRSYGVSKLPYAVLVDEFGKIASMGLINTREHFDSLFNAKETQVASLQDYLEKNTAS